MKRGVSRSAVRGAISLVALCLVAVLGIVLGSYLTLGSRAMNLSNRSFQSDLARQLAELGLEEGLRAFNSDNWNDWTNGISADWTLDTANHRARCVLTFPAKKFGQGVTAAVRIRVDNYDAASSGVTWSNAVTYGLHEVVGRNGVWHRAIQGANLNNDPGVPSGNLAWWVSEPTPWAWQPDREYTADSDLVFHNGSWWRCTDSHSSGALFAVAKWEKTEPPSFALTNATGYARNQFVYRTSDHTWYRSKSDQSITAFEPADWEAVSGNTASMPSLSWAYRDTTTYRFNDVVYHNEIWYRYIGSTPSMGFAPGASPLHWEDARSGAATGWSSNNRYNRGDVVFHGSTHQWYRCLRAHTSSTSLTPTSGPYWSNAPAYSLHWEPNRIYSQNHTARHHGVWYRSLQNNNVGQNPATATASWIGANTADAAQQWNAVDSYPVGAYRCYGGVWYRSVTATIGVSPNNSAAWTPTWSNALNVTTGAPVLYAEATLTLANSPPVRIQMRALLQPAPLFPNAAAGITDLSIQAGTGIIDSYDSSLGTSYTAQVYNPATNYSAVVAAGNRLTMAGTTAVHGYLAWPSPPGNLSTTTIVAGPSSPTSPRIDPLRISRSPAIPEFSILPAGGLTEAFSSTNPNFPRGLALAGTGTIDLGTPGGFVPTRYYHIEDLELGTAEAIHTINVNGPVILAVNGSLRVRSGGVININAHGSLELHVGRRLHIDSGAIVNRSPDSTNPDPRRVVILCDSQQSDLHTYDSPTSAFHGVIYAPNTNDGTSLHIASSARVFGALSARRLSLSGDSSLHYDLSLRHATFSGVEQPYTIAEWRELPATEAATLP